LKPGADFVEVGTMEYSHLPRSRDTLNQHPLVKLSLVLSAPRMPAPIAAAMLVHRSQPSAAVSGVVQFQTEHSVIVVQKCFLLAQEETLA
jgi:hypothetical protein